MNSHIDAEFHGLCPPLQPEEREQLEANVLAEGCRDPVCVWPETWEEMYGKYCAADRSVTAGDGIWVCDRCENALAPFPSVVLDGGTLGDGATPPSSKQEARAMPKKSQAGYSDNTPLKQHHFGIIMATLCRIVKSITHRKRYAYPAFLYLDLRAGPGLYEAEYRDLFRPGLPGGPVLALQAAHQADIPLLGYAIDQDPNAIASLCTVLPLYGGVQRRNEGLPAVFRDRLGTTQLTVCQGDSVTYLPLLGQTISHLPGKPYGVIYCDVNGGTLPVDELRVYSQLLPYVDLVLHLSPTHRKRVHGVYHTRPPLLETLPDLTKTCWIVRQPYYREQWTFLIGTNWESFPQFKKQGFVRIDTDTGQEIMHRISYRRDQP